MRLIALLALRNLRRRRLRTGLTLAMILLGTALIVFTMGLSEGTYGEMIRLATGSWAGHFQVTARDFTRKPSLYKSVPRPGDEIRRLAALPGVAAVTARVETAGLMSLGNRTSGVLLVGVDPAGERAVTTVDRAVREGAWLDAPAPVSAAGGSRFPVLLGAGLAERLRARLGDEVSFVGQAADGSIAAELFRVAGILATGSEELDAGAALVRLADARELLALGDRAHRLVGRLEDIDGAETFARRTRVSEGLVLLPWTEVLPSLHQTIQGDRAGNWIFLGVLMAVVALGVVNTMTMVVFERTKEFGVMTALGTGPGRLVGMVTAEAAWLSALGVAGGLALGAAANAVTQVWGIPVASEPITYGGVTISEMHAANTLSAAVAAPLIVFTSGVLAALGPALRAARLNPVDALRTG